jgi:hypothetical protein
LIVLALSVTGCTKPAPSSEPGPAAQTGTTFDGSYTTTIQQVSSASIAKGTQWCDTPAQSVIAVTNGQFNLTLPHPNVPGNATVAFPASINPDGSFYGQTINGTISGNVQANHIEGRIVGSACGYTFAGNRM